MNRTCERFRARMTRLLDRELPPAERRESEEHLESCAECRGEMERLRAMRALWESAPAIQSTAEERARIVAAAAPYFEKHGERVGWIAWLSSLRPGDWLTVGAAATAAILAVLLAEERRSLQIYERWPSSSTVLTTVEAEAREHGVRIEAGGSVPILDPLGSGSRESGMGRSS